MVSLELHSVKFVNHLQYVFPLQRKVLDQQLKEGQVFTEYQHIFKKRPDAIFYTAQLRENVPRNRFPDVLPYEVSHTHLTPNILFSLDLRGTVL